MRKDALCAACVLLDDQPRASAAYATGRFLVREPDARPRPALRAVLQSSPWPQRHVVGGPVPVLSRRSRTLRPWLLPLHREKSRAGADGLRAIRLSLVEPSRQP